MKLESLRGLALVCLLAANILCQAAPPPRGVTGTDAPGLNIVVNTTGNATYIDVYGTGHVFDSTQLANLTQGHDDIRRIALHGLVLPDPLPLEWAILPSLRTIHINCEPAAATAGGAAAAGPAAAPRPPAAAGSRGIRKSMGRFGTEAQLDGLRELIDLRRKITDTSIRNVSLVNCGIKGHYAEVWRTYLSDVQSVNLSGNALTGDFTSTDSFDTVCTDAYGDDYGNPDCSASTLFSLDVSRNQLSGRIGTGAALGDDVTDAVCSTACLSLVLAPGITNEEVLCRAPLVIFALDNPGLNYRSGVRFASGYVTRDHSNWCWVPDSLWVLPTMWGVFAAVMAGTLAVTLYARVRLKRVPFRMKSPSFGVLARGDVTVSAGALNGRAHGGGSGLIAASAIGGGGGYVGLADGAGYIEMAERQAMIPKTSGGGLGGGSSSGTSSGGGAVGALPPLPPLAYVSVTALPLSTAAEAAATLPEALEASSSSAANGAGARSGFRLGRSKRDPDGIREALTAGLEDSSAAAANGDGGGRPGPDPVGQLGLELYGMPDLDPGPGGGGGSGGLTLGARAAAAAAGMRSSGGGGAAAAIVAGPQAEPRWRVVCRAMLSRGLEILGMQLRTLLILGMFGLECYWAYSLILYRGGWQLLVLIPNYLEHTMAGIAMLRAFMAGTHGRWKWVAPVPLLPFTMASLYLVYGFITYPFGWADFGPVSWEKFIDLMDSCGVLSSTCWAIFSSLAYWQGNSVKTSYQYFNTDIFVGMLLMCFTDLLSTAHHLASTLQLPFKQWLRRELDVRRIIIAPDKSHRLPGDSDI